jgi:hypothetical protein
MKKAVFEHLVSARLHTMVQETAVLIQGICSYIIVRRGSYFKNWSHRHNTWEPERKILDHRLIEAFKTDNKVNKPKDVKESPRASSLQPPLLIE